jgi:hypothetical protein
MTWPPMEQIALAGGRSVADRVFAWGESALELEVKCHPLRQSELEILVPARGYEIQDTDVNSLLQALLRALGDNPETGWSLVIRSNGTLARRILLRPRTWVDRGRLCQALDAFVGAEADPAPARFRHPLFQLGDASLERSADETTAAAIAVFLLCQDRQAWDGSRHLLSEHARSIWDVYLAAEQPAPLQQRGSRETAVTEALLARPDAARKLLAVQLAGFGRKPRKNGDRQT